MPCWPISVCNRNVSSERRITSSVARSIQFHAARARPRANSGIKFAIGQVFLAFIFAPTGNGLSFFRTATRSGFERCNKNPNPIINPIFYPIFYPIATRLPQIFICFQLKFHIPDPFQLYWH